MKAERIADSAGVFGAIFAALCCLGVTYIVAGLAALGLSFLRKDAILWPLMLASLVVAMWGMWRGRRVHGSATPLIIGLIAGVALVAGVIFIHGPPARLFIMLGAVGLVVATVLNVTARLRRTRPAISGRVT